MSIDKIIKSKNKKALIEWKINNLENYLENIREMKLDVDTYADEQDLIMWKDELKKLEEGE